MAVLLLLHNDSPFGYAESMADAKKIIEKLVPARHETPETGRWDSIGGFQTMRTKFGGKLKQWSIRPLKRINVSTVREL